VATETKARFTLVCLHFLGGSALSWLKVTEALDRRFECIAVDLPGFGTASIVPGYSVEKMADIVVRIIREFVKGRWILAGHSMGAKVAAVVARRAEAGDAALAGCRDLSSWRVRRRVRGRWMRESGRRCSVGFTAMSG